MVSILSCATLRNNKRNTGKRFTSIVALYDGSVTRIRNVLSVNFEFDIQLQCMNDRMEKSSIMFNDLIFCYKSLSSSIMENVWAML